MDFNLKWNTLTASLLIYSAAIQYKVTSGKRERNYKSVISMAQMNIKMEFVCKSEILN